MGLRNWCSANLYRTSPVYIVARQRVASKPLIFSEEMGRGGNRFAITNERFLMKLCMGIGLSTCFTLATAIIADKSGWLSALKPDHPTLCLLAEVCLLLLCSADLGEPDRYGYVRNDGESMFRDITKS